MRKTQCCPICPHSPPSQSYWPASRENSVTQIRKDSSCLVAHPQNSPSAQFSQISLRLKPQLLPQLYTPWYLWTLTRVDPDLKCTPAIIVETRATSHMSARNLRSEEFGQLNWWKLTSRPCDQSSPSHDGCKGGSQKGQKGQQGLAGKGVRKG